MKPMNTPSPAEPPAVSPFPAAPFRPGNQFDLLQNGDNIFPAMLEAIAAAQHDINFLTYVFWRGHIANQFAAAHIERARAGVKVRLLIDTFGGASMDARTIWSLERAGISIAWFRPGRNPLHLRRINNRTHRKILVVDGQVGFTGGVGIADYWTGNAQDPAHWRETHCRITGPAVVDLHAGFAENWFEATGEDLPTPHPRRAGTTAVQTIISTAGRTRPTAAETLMANILAGTRRRLWITTGYFVPSDSVITGLLDAAARGVDVRVLTNGRHTDHRITMWAGRATYSRLLAGGVKIYEYDRTMHHAKIISADSAWATLGSINLDARSLILNDELNVAITDTAIISALDLQFLEDLKDSKHIRPSHWYQRSRLSRLVDHGSSVFRHQL
jgi:cardiolipin synthase